MPKLILEIEEPKDDSIVPLVEIEETVDSMLISVLEEGKETEEDVEEVSELFAKLNNIIASIENINSIRTSIMKYGISKSQMIIADPQSELVAAGLCCAYEELGEVSTKGEQADGVVEGLGDFLTGIVSKVKHLFSAIIEKLGKAKTAIGKELKTWFMTIDNLEKRLSKIDVDDADFKKMSVKSYKKEDFDRVVAAVDKAFEILNEKTLNEIIRDATHFKLMDDNNRDNLIEIWSRIRDYFEPFVGDKELTDCLGIHATSTGKTTPCKIVVSKASVNLVSTTVGSSGWELSDVTASVSTLQKMEKLNDKLENIFDKMTETCEKLAIMNGEYIEVYNEAEDGTMTKDVVMFYTDFTKAISDLSDILFKIGYYSLFQTFKTLATSTVNLASAAIKA